MKIDFRIILTFLIFLVVEIVLFIKIDANSHSVSDTLINFVPVSLLFVLLLLEALK